jgi:hypothetical protein
MKNIVKRVENSKIWTGILSGFDGQWPNALLCTQNIVKHLFPAQFQNKTQNRQRDCSTVSALLPGNDTLSVGGGGDEKL